MSTTQINTLRGELLSEIVGVEEAEVLERIKRSIARILSKECAKKEETRPRTKEEIIADLHEVGEQIRLAREGKLKGQPLEDFFHELHN